jgi:4-hydroxy-tetrahydrodipicolinate reductase
LKLLIVGYGKMGRMVEELAGGQGFEIAGRVDDGRPEWAPADVAIDFSTAHAGIGVVSSANFSIGVNVFALVVAEAARMMQAQPQYGAWIHEIHHAAKRDAPSGTALLLKEAMMAAGFDRNIDMSSARAGMIPGTHTVGFDSASDTIELTHRARDRRGFASGALLAARWIQGRSGWYSMQDVLAAGSR